MAQPEQLNPPPSEHPGSKTSPLLTASTGRRRTYSQSYQASKSSGTLRRGSISNNGGYGALLERDTERHNSEIGEARGQRYSRGGFQWGSAGIHTESEKGHGHHGRGGWGRRRILVLAGMLLLGTGVLWGLAKCYRWDYLDSPVAPALSGTSTTPDKNGYIHLITLPFNLHHPPPAPPPPPAPNKPKSKYPRRLILVGDVHGALDELKALLEKVDFDATSGADHLVLTGDVVSKGPKSGGVLDLLRKLSEAGVASCVRGNHDDRVVRAYERLHRPPIEEEQIPERSAEVENDGDVDEEEDPGEEIHGNLVKDWRDDHNTLTTSKRGSKRRQRKRASDDAVAKTLTSTQAKFLASCPLILRIPGAGHQGGDLLVVHAGIVPGVPLLKQNPELLMNMRSILPPKHPKGKKARGRYEVGRGSSTTKGRHWAEVWNEYEDARVKGELGGAELKRPEVLKGVDQEYDPVEIMGNDEEGVLVRGEKAGEQVSPVVESKASHGNPEKGNTVVYGHYAAKGLDVRRWTKGLDSNCVRGGRLSALVVKKGEKGETDMEVVGVKCRKYAN